MAHLVTLLAHPDDAEILAGGTLYRHWQRGDSLVICSLTYTPDSLRGQEGAEGARRLGADFTCFGLPDMAVQRYTPEDVERVQQLPEVAVVEVELAVVRDGEGNPQARAHIDQLNHILIPGAFSISYFAKRAK